MGVWGEGGAKSVDPDQTPRSAASDLVLHCLLKTTYKYLGYYGKMWRFSPNPSKPLLKQVTKLLSRDVWAQDIICALLE